MLQARGVNGKFLAGDKDMLAKLRKLAGKVPSTAAAALYLEGERVMREAKQNFTPVSATKGGTKGGTLKNSGMVEPPVYSGGTPAPRVFVAGSSGPAQIHQSAGKGWSVRLSFGGGASAYALAVHEHLSEHSPYSWRKAEADGRGINWRLPGTGPKYLEKPLEAARRGLQERIAEKVRMVWAGV